MDRYRQYIKDGYVMSDVDEKGLWVLASDARAIEEERDRLDRRDGNATFELILPTKENPFNKIDLKVIDFGVADNCYVLESPEIDQQIAALTAERQDIIDSYQLVIDRLTAEVEGLKFARDSLHAIIKHHAGFCRGYYKAKDDPWPVLIKTLTGKEAKP